VFHHEGITSDVGIAEVELNYLTDFIAHISAWSLEWDFLGSLELSIKQQQCL
jgi:hypothetical protein